jgi:hypothetical protein
MQVHFHGAFRHAGGCCDLEQVHIFDESQQEHRPLPARKIFSDLPHLFNLLFS